MDKHIIELDFYDDRNEIDLIMHCKEAYSALWDIDCMLRDKIKHTELTQEQEEFYEEIRALCANPLEHYQ